MRCCAHSLGTAFSNRVRSAIQNLYLGMNAYLCVLNRKLQYKGGGHMHDCIVWFVLRV